MSPCFIEISAFRRPADPHRWVLEGQQRLEAPVRAGQLMPEFRVPLTVVRQDDDLSAGELTLQDFGDHPAMVPIEANHNVIQEERPVSGRLSLGHREEYAQAQAVPMTFGESESRRILIDPMEPQSDIDCFVSFARNIQPHVLDFLAGVQNRPHVLNIR